MVYFFVNKLDCRFYKFVGRLYICSLDQLVFIEVNFVLTYCVHSIIHATRFCNPMLSRSRGCCFVGHIILCSDIQLHITGVH
jgi:hypothetical protein